MQWPENENGDPEIFTKRMMSLARFIIRSQDYNVQEGYIQFPQRI